MLRARARGNGGLRGKANLKSGTDHRGDGRGGVTTNGNRFAVVMSEDDLPSPSTRRLALSTEQ